VAPPTEQLVASGERLGCGRHTDKHGADRLLRLNHQSGWQVVVNTSSALVLKRRRCLVVEATHGMRGGQKTSNLLCFVALTIALSVTTRRGELYLRHRVWDKLLLAYARNPKPVAAKTSDHVVANKVRILVVLVTKQHDELHRRQRFCSVL